MNNFEQRLKELLWEGGDFSLQEGVMKRLYKYVGTELVEEQSFDFEDNLFLLFFKLASLENYRNINDPESKLSWNEIILKQNASGNKTQPVRQHHYDGEELRYEGRHGLVQHPSMHTIKTVVDEYQGNWILFLEEECLDSEELMLSIKDRVRSAYVPTYEKLLTVGDLIEFSKEMLDMSIELAVCAYGAHKQEDVGVAWSALSKAKEYMGLYVGARIKSEKNLTYIARRKGPYVKKRNNQFVKDCLVKKIIQLTQTGWRSRWTEVDNIKPYLAMELVPVLKSAWDTFGKKHTVSDDELVLKIENWMVTDQDVKMAFNNYLESLKLDETRPLNSNDGYVCIDKLWFEDFKNSAFREINLSRQGYSSCELRSECPVQKQKRASVENLQRLISDPFHVKK